MELKKEFDDYLADLAVFTFKLHNLHWNVTGTQFIAIHKWTEELYETVFEYFDDVAEHEKIYGYFPSCKLTEFLENAEIKEIDAKDFSAKEVLEILKSDLNILRKAATDLRHETDKLSWFSATGLFEQHIDNYNKQIWFIESSLK